MYLAHCISYNIKLILSDEQVVHARQIFNFQFEYFQFWILISKWRNDSTKDQHNRIKYIH